MADTPSSESGPTSSSPAAPIADQRAANLLRVCAAAATCLLLLGGVVAAGSPAWGYPADQRDRYCGEDPPEELVPPVLWLIWLALAGVTAVIVVVSRRHGRDVPWMTRLRRLAVAVTLVTIPFWLAAGFSADCGL